MPSDDNLRSTPSPFLFPARSDERDGDGTSTAGGKRHMVRMVIAERDRVGPDDVLHRNR